MGILKVKSMRFSYVLTSKIEKRLKRDLEKNPLPWTLFPTQKLTVEAIEPDKTVDNL